jgi:hypothetical protein
MSTLSAEAMAKREPESITLWQSNPLLMDCGFAPSARTPE